jgi:GNAT superfamily N-acetyltransferase
MRRRGLSFHLPGSAGGPWHRTIVAEERGSIVGVGSAIGMPWHPSVVLADVMVEETARRRGTGTALLERVRAEVRSVGNQRLCSQLRPHATAGKAFAAARGLRMVMRSRFWQFEPADARILAWIERASQSTHGYRILPNVDSADPRVGPAIRDLYDWMHAGWNPMGPISAAQVGAAFAPDIVPGTAALAFRGDKVIGVANLLRTPGMPTMRPFVSMVGVTNPELPHAAELTAHLAALSFEQARVLGIGLEAEADDAHVHLAAALERLPAVATNQLLQFIG